MADGYRFALGEAMMLADESGATVSIGDWVADCSGERWLVCGADAMMTFGMDELLLSATIARNGIAGSIRKTPTMRGRMIGYSKQ